MAAVWPSEPTRKDPGFELVGNDLAKALRLVGVLWSYQALGRVNLPYCEGIKL